MSHSRANESAPVFEKAQTLIDAPVETVWNVLCDFERWPQWNRSVTKMQLKGPVEVGTTFIWTAGGSRIVSRIEHLSAPNLIVWSGTTMGIHAVHKWEFTQTPDGTNAYTEESFDGLIVKLLKGPMKKMLANSINQGLQALKTEAQNCAS